MSTLGNCCTDKVPEEGVGCERLGLKLGMELGRHEPGMVFDFNNFNQGLIECDDCVLPCT